LMRPIQVVSLDKARPAVILTREPVRQFRSRVTVAPISSTIRGLSTEVRVDETNGLDHESAVSVDNIATVPSDHLGHLIGYLTPEQDRELAQAIIVAFDLDVIDTRGDW
jgi:mRNA interferase MazF